MITSLRGLADFISIIVIVNLLSARVKNRELFKLICIGTGSAEVVNTNCVAARKKSKKKKSKAKTCLSIEIFF